MLDCRENVVDLNGTFQIHCEAHDAHYDCNKILASKQSVQCLEVINEGRFECFDFKHK